MRLHKLILGILAAVAAFTLGISAYAAVGLALSYLPTKAATSVAPERNIPETAPVAAVPIPLEPIFVGPSVDDESRSVDPNEEFDASGSYAIDVEKVLKAFADIDRLLIETNDYTSDANGEVTVTKIAPRGSLFTNKELRFERISIGNNKLVFQTATVNGVSYKFSGSFLTEAYCETDGDTPDLKGRLIKIKNNKWAAEMEAEFYMQCGC